MRPGRGVAGYSTRGLSLSSRTKVAEVLAGSPAAFDSQGLQAPAFDPIMMAASMGGPALARVLSGVGKMSPMALASEAGAIFPEGTASEALPVVARGAKTGDPHALYAYSDNFGPEMAKRDLYNIFGDPTHPAVQQAGWGSSVTGDVLKKFGIPIVGKEPPRSF